MEFRISVCLKRYFDDERSYCYVMVDERQGRVASLEQRLRALFGLPGSFCLMSQDHYLPREEKLSVLRPDDSVMIVPLERDWREQDDKKSHIEEKGEIETGAEVEIAPRSPESVASADTAVSASLATNNGDKAVKKKKKKKFKPDLTNEASTELEPAPASSPLPLEAQHGNGHENGAGEAMDAGQAATDPRGGSLQQLKLKALSLLQEVATGAGVGAAGGVTSGRVTKRRRVRRRNRHSSLASAASPPSSPSPPSQEPPSQAPLLPAPATFPPAALAPPGPGPTHTRFPEVGPPPVLQNVAADAGACAARARVVLAEGRPAAEAVVSVEALLRRLPEFPIMDAATYPMPRDLVLFRTLRLDGGAPRVYGAVLGRVLSVACSSAQKGAVVVVFFHVLEGHEELRAGGVAVNAEGVVKVPWSSVLDPRLVFP